MALNKKQRAVLLVGLMIIILMGSFPPWTYFNSYREFSAGYTFIVTPPYAPGELGYGVKLDLSRLVVQWIMVLMAMGIGVLLTSGRSKE